MENGGGAVMTDQEFVQQVVLEAERARAKFPAPNPQLAALVEEVGEVAKALLSEDWEHVRAECIQVAAMALRIALDGDGFMEPYRQREALGVQAIPDVDKWKLLDRKPRAQYEQRSQFPEQHPFTLHKTYTGPGCAICGRPEVAHNPVQETVVTPVDKPIRLRLPDGKTVGDLLPHAIVATVDKPIKWTSTGPYSETGKSMRETITCYYSCKTCGVTRQAVQVPARTDRQDVVEWMQKTAIVAIGNDHRQRSPFCSAGVADIAIPIEDDTPVGGAVPPRPPLGKDIL